jgi:endoglycosylceramidase
MGPIGVNTTTRFMVDSARRSVLLHGVNVVYKVDPYIPTTNSTFDPQLSLNDDDIMNLVFWGFNFVRLGVMWEAVERSKGVYNDTYLGEILKLVNKLGENGIYTMIDAHQDVFARTICGEGVPAFYLD